MQVKADGQVAVTASRLRHQTYEKSETEFQQNAAFETHPPRSVSIETQGCEEIIKGIVYQK